MVLKIPWNSLKKRDWPYIAPFEYNLIYREIHKGWVEYTGKNRKFRLRKSPFSPFYSPYIYIAPEDKMPPENAFISVEGRERKVPRFGKKIEINGMKKPSTLGEYEYIFEVENWCEDEPEILKPYTAALEDYLEDKFGVRFEGMFTMKEMLYYLTLGWNDAVNDGLDFALGALYVSCPPEFYGHGGISVQVYALGSGGRRSVLRHYANYMAHLMPVEFKKGHEMYAYVNVDTESKARTAVVLEKRTKELNMSYFGDIIYRRKELRPLQMPLILETASPRKIDDVLPPDLLAYQLTALMIKPKVDDRSINEFVETIKYVNRVIKRNDDFETKIDLNSINRLVEAITRMHLRTEISEERFKEAKDRFMGYYTEYLELKEYLEPFTHRGVMYGSNVRTSYLHYHLTRKEINVLLTIMKLWEDEYGKSWIPMERIKKEIKDENMLFDAISVLQDYGYIIQKMNYAYVMPVVIDEDIGEL